MRLLRLLLASFLFLAAPAVAGKAAFGDWAAAVVAGDWRGHNGLRIEAFDNARRDVAAALVDAGFAPVNIRQFSPDPGPGILDASPNSLMRNWIALTQRTSGGCLLYITSHGTPGRIIIGERELSPGEIDAMLDVTCAGRPTVVVLSACYSGSFIPALAEPNRLVVTAARADRSSFGCGAGVAYPYFDECVLKALPDAPDLATMATTARTCVAAREKSEKLTPPSEPQVRVGEDIAKLVPRLSLKPD